MPLEPQTRPAGAARPLSLEQLVLLNEELRGLIRAGIPLELGLRGSSARIGGRLGQLTERLAARLESGATLDGALQAEGHRLPAAYRAILTAGLRSGRLDEVLVAVTRFGQAMHDMRAYIRRAMIYPAAVFVLAYVLFTAIVLYFVPELERTYALFDLPDTWWLPLLRSVHRTVGVWGPAVPLIALGLGLLPWLFQRFDSIAADDTERPLRVGPMRALPGVGGMVRDAQLARFAHLLSLMVEYRVPFPEAARLSAAATGNRRLISAMHAAADRVEAGHSLEQALSGANSVPPFLRWLMVVGERQSGLAPSLRQAAHVYQQRAAVRAEWIQRIVPLVLVIGLGGGITFVYALTVFVPMASLWKSLG